MSHEVQDKSLLYKTAQPKARSLVPSTFPQVVTPATNVTNINTPHISEVPLGGSTDSIEDPVGQSLWGYPTDKECRKIAIQPPGTLTRQTALGKSINISHSVPSALLCPATFLFGWGRSLR